MDVETRSLLYLVVLGSLAGLGALAARRLREYRVHALHLVVLALLGTSALVFPARMEAAAAWIAGAYAVLGVVPWWCLAAGRRARAGREFGPAARLTTAAAVLLGGPAPILREAALCRAFAAADRGDADACRELLADLAARGALAGLDGGEALARIAPALAARRWEEALAEVDRVHVRGPAVLAAETRAAGETGDVERALHAANDLARFLPKGSPLLAPAQRAVLAAAGRSAFLEDARRRGLPVAGGGRGEIGVAIARAYEASGDVAAAARAYDASLADARGAVRADAEAGLERCRRGKPVLARVPTDALDALRDLEVRCRIEEPDPRRRPLFRRAPATLAFAILCTAYSAGVLLAAGDDVRSLVAAGALSAQLAAEGHVWRLGTAMLLHGGWVHLAINVATVLWVGIPYEVRLGPSRTVVVLLGSGFAASAASAHLAATDVGVGASGAALGLFAAYGVLVAFRSHLFDPRERRIWLALAATGLAATGLVGALESAHVDNAAHAGGALAGAVLGLALLPRAAEGDVGRVVRRGAATVLGAAIAACVVAAVAGSGQWIEVRTVHVAGVRADLPEWLARSVRSEGSDRAIARRPPLPFLVRLGPAGAAPADPDALLALVPTASTAAAPGREHWKARPPRRWTVQDLEIEERRYAPFDPETAVALRAVTFRRGAASAVVLLPDGPDGAAAFGADAARVGRTLAPDEGAER